MSAVREFIDPLLNVIGRYLPNAFGAIIILLVGWVLIELLGRAFAKGLAVAKLDEHIKGDKEKSPIALEKFLTRVLRYVLLLCLFLLVLDILGVQGVLDPVRNMFDKFMVALPNLVAGMLIAIIGFIIAKMVAGVVTVVLSGLDKLNAKFGLSDEFSLAKFVGHLVFIFIFVPVLVAALDAVKIEAVSQPATAMLESLMLAVPNIVGAALILAVAFFVGRFVANVVSELLKNLGTDALPGKLGLGGVFGEKLTCSRLIGGVVLLFIMLGAALSAGEILQLTQLSELLRQMAEFAGDIVLGLIILALGGFLANVAHKALIASGTSSFMAAIGRVAIIGLVAAMGLRRMGIADDIVRLAFGLTIGGIAVAFALSFGLGGREAAGKQLEAWFAKMRAK